MSQKPTSKPEAGKAPGNIIEFPQSPSTTAANALAKTMISISRNELTSIKALTGYVAHNQNVSEDVVRAIVQSEFKVDDIASLRRDDYERAIKFLVDLQVELLLN
jgi:hypothetical protein